MLDPRWPAWVIAGSLLGLSVLLAITTRVLEPAAAEAKARHQQEVMDRSDVGWEDVGTQRCYWLKTDPERKVCVPMEGR